MQFTLDTTGITNILERLNAAKDAVPVLMQAGIQQIAENSIVLLKNYCPVDDEENNGMIPGEEGHLTDSFEVANEAITSNAFATADVITTEPVKFGFVTQGTADIIMPVQKRGLWWPALSHPVAWVHGQEANNFPVKAVPEIESNVQDIATQIGQTIVTIARGD